MRKILNKGHRIRASDKHLVYHFSIGTLLFVFVAAETEPVCTSNHIHLIDSTQYISIPMV